jgi:DNA polymerase III epsilon subunit-like protein
MEAMGKNMENLGKEAQEELVREYLKALDDRALEKCLSFFSPGAVINFMEGLYEGEEAIRQWHEDRFQADLRIVEVEDIQIEGDCVTVSTVIRSDRLLDWKIPQLSGYAKAKVEKGKIQELTFGLNVTNPLEDWS